MLASFVSNFLFVIKGYKKGKIWKKSIFQFCNILKDIRIENTYAKFQRKIWKIDGDTTVFVEQHFCRRAAVRSSNCRMRVNNLNS